MYLVFLALLGGLYFPSLVMVEAMISEGLQCIWTAVHRNEREGTLACPFSAWGYMGKALSRGIFRPV